MHVLSADSRRSSHPYPDAGSGVSWRVAWPSAETGSLPLDGGVAAAFKSQIQAAPDPQAALEALTRQIDNLRSPLRTAAVSRA